MQANTSLMWIYFYLSFLLFITAVVLRCERMIIFLFSHNIKKARKLFSKLNQQRFCMEILQCAHDDAYELNCYT